MLVLLPNNKRDSVREKLKNILIEQKLAKKECWQMLNNLSSIEEQDDELLLTIERLTTEYTMRGLFINQIEDLLND